MKSFLSFKCLCLCVLCSLAHSTHGQNPASCFSLRLSTEQAQAGDTVRVRLTTRGFTDMVSMQFKVSWDTAALKFIHINPGNSLVSPLQYNVASAPSGKIPMQWYDYYVEGVTLPDDFLFFSIDLKVVADTPGFYPVEILPEGSVPYEIINDSNRRMPLAEVVGGARIGPASDLGLSFCLSVVACSNLPDLAPVVEGGIPPYTFTWNGPGGLVDSVAILTGLQEPGEYHFTVVDSASQQAQAIAYVEFGQATFYVQIDSTKAAQCGQPNGCAYLKTLGGTPPFTFAWNDGAVTQEPYYCHLSPWSGAVTVTDAQNCLFKTSFLVYDEQTLTLEADSTNADCRFQTLGSATAHPQGIAPFTYSWASGSSAPSIGDLRPGEYSVTVTDAAGCRDSASTQVLDYGTFDWYLSITATCEVDTGPSRLTLKAYDFADRAEYPLTVSWSNGTAQSVPVYVPEGFSDKGILSTLTGMAGGPYSVTVTDAQGCSASQSKFLDCIPGEAIGQYTNVSFRIVGESNSNTLDSCVRVYADGEYGMISKLDTVHFAMEWPHFQFKEIQIPNSSFTGITQSNFTFFSNNSGIEFAWDKVSYHHLTSSMLFKVCFQNSYGGINWPVEFIKGSEPPIVHHATMGERGFVGMNGRAYLHTETYNSTPAFYHANLSLPDCANDGYAGIRLGGYWISNVNNYRQLEVQYNGKEYTDPDIIRFAKPGNYRVSQATSGYSTFDASLYAHVPEFPGPATDCAWPGDADDNGVVNHFDLLYLGLGWGASGPMCSDSSGFFWTGFECPDWPDNTPNRQVNFKHFNLFGAPPVDAFDTIPISLHWGEAVHTYRGNYTAPPVRIDTLPVGASIGLLADTLMAGETVAIPIALGPADDSMAWQGLAFSFCYDPALLASADVKFVPSVSWLGDPEADLLLMQRNFSGERRLDVALTRTNGPAAAGVGVIGHIELTFKELPSASTSLSTTAFLTQALAMTPDERFFHLTCPPVSLLLQKPAAQVSSIGGAALDEGVVLSPNPATRIIRLRSNSTPIEAVEIRSAAGAVCSAISADLPTLDLTLPVEKLSPGIYFAKISTRLGVICKTFAIAR